ncbi:CLUMA_CG018697, isoform A [Clunio marinus]|uniref:CLUMA_CG018697, isoform A n=1 Tax=Clunio marinus TaxID=568069 RepID=A0A1J1IZN0_9DIPT|nr:CLUMA_CG018697, isoform A [Clunio marinus]
MFNADCAQMKEKNKNCRFISVLMVISRIENFTFSPVDEASMFKKTFNGLVESCGWEMSAKLGKLMEDVVKVE